MNPQIFLIFLLVGILGCESPPNNKVKVVNGPLMPLNIVLAGDSPPIIDTRDQASTLIDRRQKQHNFYDELLVSTYWTWKGFHSGQKFWDENEYKGQWIKFNKDFTYQYGHYKNISGSGRYHYRSEDESLIILDNNTELHPKEWRLISNGTEISLNGRHGFGLNNGCQMMLLPNSATPSKG